MKLRTKLYRATPTILSIISSVGVIATAVITAKETPKAMKLLDEAKKERLDKFETFVHVAPAYIPAVGTGIGTIVCVLGANALNKKQQASLVSAITLLDKSYRQYRQKVIDIHGKEEDSNIRKSIAIDNIKETNDGTEIIEDGKLLFFEPVTATRFRATMPEVQRAEYYLNRNFTNRGDANLGEFLSWLKVKDKPVGCEEFGWDWDYCVCEYGLQWIDIWYDKATTDDGLECYIIQYSAWPQQMDCVASLM